VFERVQSLSTVFDASARKPRAPGQRLRRRA
jgi:hypothetical protein